MCHLFKFEISITTIAGHRENGRDHTQSED